jgi:succinate dehydrogenase / fumarate reductase cytochrome b subunit
MVIERSLPDQLPAAAASRLRRLHAFAGAIPLGAFLLLHLVEQSAALRGRDGQSPLEPRSPLLLALEIALVYVPLCFHAGYGVFASVAQARATRQVAAAPAPGKPTNRTIERRTFQLATGAVVGLFLLAHLWQFRVRLWTGELEPADFFDELSAGLSSTAFGGVPLTALGYLIALGAVAFHFSNGLYGACRTWGIPLGERSARATTGLLVAAGVGLFALGAITVIYLATGSVSLPSVGY